MLPNVAEATLRGDALRERDWNGEATALYARGDFEGAIELLIGATKALPYAAHIWQNLGQVLLVRAARDQLVEGPVQPRRERLVATPFRPAVLRGR